MRYRWLFVILACGALLAPPASAATRTYTRASLFTCSPAQLAAMIDTALSRTGTTVDIDGLTVKVTHPQLVAANDAIVNAQISAYVYDPLFGLPAVVVNLRGQAPTLRQWASDASNEVAAWDTKTQAQKDAALKLLIQRLGILLDRLADVITVQGLN